MNLTIPHSLLVAPQKNWDGVMQIASRPIALIGTYLSSEDSKIQLLAIMIVRNSIQTILYPPTLYFPTMEDIETESLEKIHQIWKANHETLIGIIEKHEIPHFGFHGTPKAELEGICSSKSARYPGYLWVAGLACHLDSITTLADFYTMMGKACNYQHQRAGNGGLFVVRTDTARCYRKYIWLSTHLQHKGLDIDTAQEKKFANLVNRNSIGDNPWVGGFFYKSTDGVKEVSTQDLHFADEMHLDLNPTNYYSIVKGIIPYAETSYPGTKIGKLNTEENWPRWALGHRLKKQEILIKAFQGLKILQDWSPSELIKYRKIGKALSRNIEQVTSVSVLALTKLPYSLYPIKLPTETLATLQK